MNLTVFPIPELFYTKKVTLYLYVNNVPVGSIGSRSGIRIWSQQNFRSDQIWIRIRNTARFVQFSQMLSHSKLLLTGTEDNAKRVSKKSNF
jgi:hypothetical protein